MLRLCFLLAAFPALSLLSSCGNAIGSVGTYSGGGTPNMGGPSVVERENQIATEPRGDFYYGRRYFVEQTRFWGYLRKPGQSARQSKLVVFNEARGAQPDRKSEIAAPSERYGFDNNYEYRIQGYYTGEKAYEINSNQFLPEFMITGYELLDRDPGWLFSPSDHYDRARITLSPNF